MFQWRYLYDTDAEGELAMVAELEAAAAARGGGAEADEVEFKREEEEEEAGGDQALAVKPFLSAVTASKPTGYKASSRAGSAPGGNLVLKHAHGFRSHDVRGNAKYTADGKIVFTTAALGVVQERATSSAQEFFTLHEDDVVSMAVHPDGDIVATGQMAARGKAKMVDVFVWRASTQEVLAQLTGFHRRAVNCLAFSPNGSKLLTVGADDQHSVAIYDWASQALLCTTRTGPDRAYDAAWKSESEFMTVDPKFVRFHTAKGQSIGTKKGLLGAQRAQLKDHLCGSYAFGGALCISGN